MASPLYFLPDITPGQLRDGDRLRASVVAERGLAHVLTDIASIQRELSIAELTGAGPGGKSGVILCALRADGRLPGKLGYYPQSQTWHEQPGHWIGLAKDAPPEPADLARRKLYDGYLVTLADGAQWQIATARRPDDSTELPREMFFTSEGHFVEQIKTGWREAWERAGECLEWFTKGFEGSGSYRAEILDQAIRAVGINYRFGRGEQAALKLIDSDNWLPVLCALVDWYAAADQKKTPDEPPPGETSATPGEPDSCPATDPAAESCSSSVESWEGRAESRWSSRS